MNEAWEVARDTLQSAQRKQKKHHDKHARNANFEVGSRVFVFMPSLKSGPAYKLALPYKGPYRIMQLYENGADVQLIDCPRAQPIRVALNRLRHCPQCVDQDVDTTPDPSSVPNTSNRDIEATPHDTEETTSRCDTDTFLPDTEQLTLSPAVEANSEEVNILQEEDTQSLWKNRLRPRKTGACGHAG